MIPSPKFRIVFLIIIYGRLITSSYYEFQVSFSIVIICSLVFCPYQVQFCGVLLSRVNWQSFFNLNSALLENDRNEERMESGWPFIFRPVHSLFILN